MNLEIMFKFYTRTQRIPNLNVRFLLFISAIIILVGYAAELSAESGTNKSFEDRMALIEQRQDLLVESAHKDVERLYLIFAGVAAFFALFSIFSAFRQLREDNSRQRLEEQEQKEVQKVMVAFRDNISTINSLISTLKDTIDYRTQIAKDLEKVDQRLIEFSDYKESEEQAYRSRVDSLNRRASHLFLKCQIDKSNREAFKREEHRTNLEPLGDNFDTLLTTGDLTELVSPIGLFLRGLSFFNAMDYENALLRLLEARENAEKQVINPLPQYGTWAPDEIQKYLQILIKEASYHIGIIQYNLGYYEKARQDFEKAYSKDSLDFRSRIYIPELMFFDHVIEPSVTEAEYEKIEMELNNITSDKRKKMLPNWETHYASLKMRQGNFYLPKKDLRPKGRELWAEYENPDKALNCFWEAKEKTPSSTFVTFSLAQAMYYKGPSSLWRDLTPEKLFKETFYQFRNDAVLKTEPILLTLLFYCTAISCYHAQIRGESPSPYLVQARQHLQRVPQGIKIFSPINKINREKADIIKEIDQLEQQVWIVK